MSRLPHGRAHPDAPGVADVGGLVLFAVATLTLLFGFSSAGHRFPWLSLWTLVLFGGGALLWYGLIVHERRVVAPFFPIELLRIRAVSLSINAIICNSICRIALVFYLPIYLQFGAHMDAGKAGLLLVPIMIGTLIAQQSASRIGFRTGTMHLMPAVGAALTCLGMLGLALVPPTEWLLVSFGCLVGLGLGPTMPCTQFLVQSVAGRSRLGAVTSLIMLARTSGAGLGAAVTGAIIYGLLPDVDIRHLMDGEETRSMEEVLRAFHIQFFFLAAVSGYSALVAWRMPRVKI